MRTPRVLDVVAGLCLALGVCSAFHSRCEVVKLRADMAEHRRLLYDADRQVRRWSRVVDALQRSTGVVVREDWDDGLEQYVPEAEAP